MHQAQFDQASHITFTEKKRKPFDSRRLQAAMFMDRPDLWRSKARTHRKRVPKEQEKLF